MIKELERHVIKGKKRLLYFTHQPNQNMEMIQ